MVTPALHLFKPLVSVTVPVLRFEQTKKKNKSLHWIKSSTSVKVQVLLLTFDPEYYRVFTVFIDVGYDFWTITKQNSVCFPQLLA